MPARPSLGRSGTTSRYATRQVSGALTVERICRPGQGVAQPELRAFVFGPTPMTTPPRDSAAQGLSVLFQDPQTDVMVLELLQDVPPAWGLMTSGAIGRPRGLSVRCSHGVRTPF